MLDGAAASVAGNKEVIFVPSKSTTGRFNRPASPRSLASEAADVIDLGAPRSLRRAAAPPLPGGRPRRPAPYAPSPRLYPGPTAKQKQKRKRKRSEGRSHLVFRRPVPNSRLYRPAPRRTPPPAPASAPGRAWPPPVPPAPALVTASRAALRLAACRRPRAPPAPAPPPQPPPPLPPPARRLVVTLPPGAAATMEAPPSPEGSEAASAPSEFLAEFLSAIMRRQYAEALKYCRLILQYEPHNATARGFYPLLQHKLQAHNDNDEAAGAGARRSSLSDSSGAAPSRSSSCSQSRSHTPSDDHFRNVASSWEGSGASQSSLELDSWSGEREPPAAAAAADTNGNLAPPPPRSDDLENDNDVSSFKSGAEALAAAPAHASLRRLRAHFACSIK